MIFVILALRAAIFLFKDIVDSLPLTSYENIFYIMTVTAQLYLLIQALNCVINDLFHV